MHCGEGHHTTWSELCIVQILMAVALTQMRILKTEEKKGSM